MRFSSRLVQSWALALAILVGGCATVPQPERRPPVFTPPASRPIPRPQAPAADYRLNPPPGLAANLDSLARSFNGKLGIAVMRTDGNWMYIHQGDQLFPQQSVSKLWVALTVFDAVDSGRISLDQKVTVNRDDLTVFHQPIAELVGKEGFDTNVSELLLRQMTQSDNTANDSLLRTVGGPEAVRAMLARKGIDGVRFGPGERLLQSKTAGLTWRQSYATNGNFFKARNALPDAVRQTALDTYLETLPDGAQPQAIARALARLKQGQLLSPNSTRVLLSLMNEAQTGKQRVHGGVPYDWQYGHKTGTGQEFKGLSTGYNDVGIMTAPDGTSYALAVMIASTRVGIPTRQAMMQGVSAAIAAAHRK